MAIPYNGRSEKWNRDGFNSGQTFEGRETGGIKEAEGECRAENIKRSLKLTTSNIRIQVYKEYNSLYKGKLRGWK